MDSRRKFIGKVAYGLAGTLAAGPARVLGANERVRIGIIGAGDRGMELVNHIRACSNTEIAGFADVYSRRLETAAGLAPGATVHTDYRRLLDDPSVDAVIIATPQHLHAQHFCDALEAGKHVYLEKTMALTFRTPSGCAPFTKATSRHVVQIGHQACSFGHMTDVRQFLSRPDRMGKITAIAMQMHRNTPVNKPQWARPALLTPDLTPDRLVWAAFLGDAPSRAFDPNRFMHWRYFWDYSGGNVFERMSQQLSFWYGTLNLDIPQAATMKGGIYLWKDGRQVPDTVNVTLQQPEEILVSWVSGFGNNQLGVAEDVLGTHGSISARQPGPLCAAEGEPAGSAGSRRPLRACPARPYAEFLRLHPPGQASRTAPSISAFASPSPAAWPWTVIAKAARFAGTRSAKKSFNPANFF